VQVNEILEQAKAELMPFLEKMRYDKIVNVRKVATETKRMWMSMTLKSVPENRVKHNAVELPKDQSTQSPFDSANPHKGEKQDDWFDSEKHSRNDTVKNTTSVTDKSFVPAIPIDMSKYFNQDKVASPFNRSMPIDDEYEYSEFDNCDEESAARPEHVSAPEELDIQEREECSETKALGQKVASMVAAFPE